MKVTKFDAASPSNLGGSTLIPGSAASGDLGGTLPAPTVVGIGGIAITGTPAATDLLQYNGTNWVYVLPSAIGTPTTLAALTDVSLASLANADRLRYSTADSKWHNSALIWRPLTVFNGTNWLPLVDGSGNAIMTEA